MITIFIFVYQSITVHFESLFKAAEHIVFFANSEGAITDLPRECLPDADALHEISEFIKYFDEHRAYSYYRG